MMIADLADHIGDVGNSCHGYCIVNTSESKERADGHDKGAGCASSPPRAPEGRDHYCNPCGESVPL